MGKGDDRTEQVEVRTRVPAYQKQAWVNDAEELDMSQTEFVRTMVQAGRRELGLREEDENRSEARSVGADPQGEPVKDRVVVALEEGPCEWDELVTAVTADLEDQLDAALTELQSEGRVYHSGRAGGYVLDE